MANKNSSSQANVINLTKAAEEQLEKNIKAILKDKYARIKLDGIVSKKNGKWMITVEGGGSEKILSETLINMLDEAVTIQKGTVSRKVAAKYYGEKRSSLALYFEYCFWKKLIEKLNAAYPEGNFRLDSQEGIDSFRAREKFIGSNSDKVKVENAAEFAVNNYIGSKGIEFFKDLRVDAIAGSNPRGDIALVDKNGSTLMIELKYQGAPDVKFATLSEKSIKNDAVLFLKRVFEQKNLTDKIDDMHIANAFNSYIYSLQEKSDKALFNYLLQKAGKFEEPIEMIVAYSKNMKLSEVTMTKDLREIGKNMINFTGEVNPDDRFRGKPFANYKFYAQSRETSEPQFLYIGGLGVFYDTVKANAEKIENKNEKAYYRYKESSLAKNTTFLFHLQKAFYAPGTTPINNLNK